MKYQWPDFTISPHDNPAFAGISVRYTKIIAQKYLRWLFTNCPDTKYLVAG